MSSKLLVFLCAFLSLTACIKKAGMSHSGLSPEQVVQGFVDLSAGAKEAKDQERLQQFCSGDLRRTLERMNEEAFRLIYLDNEIKVLDYKVLDQKQEGDTASVVYRLTLDNKQGTDQTREVNTREVELRRQGDSWFITGIRVKGTDQVAFTRGMIF